LAVDSKDFLIIACTVSIQSQSVTDGRTDGQTDDMIVKTRLANLSRVKIM